MKAVAILVAIIAIIAAAGLGFMWQKTNGELKDTQAKLSKSEQTCKQAVEAKEAAEAEVANIQAKLAELETAKKTAESSLAALQAKYDELTANLGGNDEGGEDALAALQNTISELKTQITEKEGEVESLTKEIESAKEKIEGLTAQVAEETKKAEAAKAAQVAAEKKAADYKQNLLEHGIAVDAPPVFEGEVLEVNPAGADYPASYILSLGKSSGLPVGQELKVVRGTDYIGTINVVRIYEDAENISGAESKVLVEGKTVQKGDKVSSEVGLKNN